MSSKENITIYILRLKQGRYYVGKTERDINIRLMEHKRENGSEWTRKYPVLDLCEKHENQSTFDEDKFVKKFMLNFGINMVRGGAYSSIRLKKIKRRLLRRNYYMLRIAALNVKRQVILPIPVQKLNLR